MTRRSRSDIVSALQSTQPWSQVLVDSLSESAKPVYRRRKAAIDAYIEFESVGSIYTATGINTSELHRLIAKCLKVHEDGLTYGYRGLIPNIHMSGYTRTAPVKHLLPEIRAGYAGVLGQVFRTYPELKDLLVGKVLKSKKENKLHEFAIKPQALHKVFIDFLRSKNHPKDEWPFNTSYWGSRSISSLLSSIVSHNFDGSVMARGDQAAKAHIAVGLGIEPLLKLDDFMDIFEVDSHKIDGKFVVAINNAEGLKSYINLKRLNILALVERSSSAVWWYLVVYSAEVSARDVVRLITESLRAELPPPSSNVLGLTLPEQGGFPSAKFPALKHALPSVLMADNALSNLACAVSYELRKELGFSLCYGPPGHFEARPNVERTFKSFTEMVFQRMPNTTGSKPSDGNQGAEIAIKYEIEADLIEELAHYHFWRSNGLPSEGISGLSPNEFIRQKLQIFDEHMVTRTPLQDKIDSASNYRVSRKVKVRCYPTRGVRPYIQLDRVRYSNELLRHSAWLKDTEITILIDEYDMRAVTAYFPDGTLLGTLLAAGKWAETRHGRKTRQAINTLRASRLLIILESDDPVSKYLDYLENSSQTSSKAKSKSSSKSKANTTSSTEFLRVTKEVEFDSLEAGFDQASTNVTDVSEFSKQSEAMGEYRSLMPTTMPDLRKLFSRS